MSAVTKFRPLFDRVLVQRLVAETRTAGGVILPEAAQSKVNEGTIVAVGPGAAASNGSIVTPVVNVGEKVVLPEYGGTPLKLGGEEYTLYREAEIVGVLDA
ncbi:hsp10-like protein [Sphaeroforma arctica JP610]|uniref:Hsp10-like protein n=1 Tax=Sphaeroforma arctica JP610 TaxID=667725 RepID=A0A0L0FPI2_9EUKA|nr:hsp10-like protein [Sphaeroforma arctica JP610]KNC78614.1 hsp10-like protein [Sphaeroforma arctica JP610]|eukprot:XP_014152516.1 hsp10-like protein [Sphaeroforma arctica JP610]